MAKIILNDNTEEFLSPGAARAKVAAGEATFPQDPHNGMGAGTTYNTRQLVAEPVKAEPVKKRRKRKAKPEVIPEEIIPEEPAAEPEQVEADEVE